MKTLKTQIFLFTAVLAAIAGGLMAWHGLGTQETLLSKFAVHRGRIIAETIHSCISASMAQGRSSDIAVILERISHDPAILTIQIFDESGRILISSDPGEVGGIAASSDLFAFRSGQLSFHDGSRTNRTHTTMLPIMNAPACYGCHQQQQKLLGILDVHLSHAELAVLQSKGTLSTLLSSMGIMVVILLSVSAVTLIFLDRPLKAQATALQALLQGDPAHYSAEQGRARKSQFFTIHFDSLSERMRDLRERTREGEQALARAEEQLALQHEIRSMNVTLEERLKEVEHLNVTLEERIEEIEEANYRAADLTKALADRNLVLEHTANRLQTLYALGMSLNAGTDREELFRRMLQGAMKSLQAQLGYVLLLDRTSWTVTIGSALGLRDEYGSGVRFPLESSEASHWVLINRQPLLITDLEGSNEFNATDLFGAPLESVICAPLAVHNETIGSVTLANRSDAASFTPDDLKWLTYLVAQAGVAIGSSESG